MKMKKWFEVLVEIIFMISIILGASDFSNLGVFIISKIVAIILIISTGYLLINYGREV
jgi:hypothetical protein